MLAQDRAVDSRLERKLLNSPAVREAMRKAPDEALNDPALQQVIADQASKLLTKEQALNILGSISEWCNDPETQAKARHYAGLAMDQVGDAGQQFVGVIEQGPAGVRVLAFIAGCFSLVLCILKLIDITNLTNLVAYAVSIYQCLFALSTMLFEAKPEWIEKVGGPINYYQNLLITYCKFFTMNGGRGLFYVFQGSLWLIQVANLGQFLEIAAGGFLMFIGLLHVLMHFDVMPQDLVAKAKHAAGSHGGYDVVNSS